jgi:hypothetical protein
MVFVAVIIMVGQGFTREGTGVVGGRPAKTKVMLKAGLPVLPAFVTRTVRGGRIQKRFQPRQSQVSWGTTWRSWRSVEMAKGGLRCCVQTEERTESRVSRSVRHEELPWGRSITGEGSETLLYMPFVKWQLEHLQSLGPLRVVPTPSHLAYRCSGIKPARIGKENLQARVSRR